MVKDIESAVTDYRRHLISLAVCIPRFAKVVDKIMEKIDTMGKQASSSILSMQQQDGVEEDDIQKEVNRELIKINAAYSLRLRALRWLVHIGPVIKSEAAWETFLDTEKEDAVDSFGSIGLLSKNVKKQMVPFGENVSRELWGANVWTRRQGGLARVHRNYYSTKNQAETAAPFDRIGGSTGCVARGPFVPFLGTVH